ncbi:leucine-rich repeat domain-containing protein [Diaphorobacter caeni]|uniref:leucine-rich repeat domain-containing protein n=1 Tax=Diaphorobacter caeni TaxID=2784387 RepID=UPI00188E1203|nr:IPTL-CTERM sorting domain-containing protein [Diaphorobacter caeni]MBF5006043.1 IPTL-CTERM sorting domain-containing protein [Diaphorobacter caeni]
MAFSLKNDLIRMVRIGVFSVLALGTLPATAAVSATVKSALLIFYDRTNGAGWTNNTGWSNPDSDPCADGWFGVSCHLDQVTEVSLPGNGLSGTVNLAYMPNLSRLDVSDNALTGLTLSNLPQLQSLLAGDNQLAGTVSVANLPRLSFLRLSDNQLTELSLTQLPALSRLEVRNNRISALVLADFLQLIEVHAPGNPLSRVELSNLPELLELDISNGALQGQQPLNLNLADLPKLREVTAENAGIVSLEVTHLPALEDLEITNNRLTLLTLSDLAALRRVEADNNRIADLSLTNLPSLERLNVLSNALTALNLADLPKLDRVQASANRIASMALVNLPLLTELDVSFNALTTLNLAGLPSLIDVQAIFNHITSADLSGLPDGLDYLNLAANRLHDAAPVLRAAQAASLGAGSGAMICPNAVSEAATPGAQNVLWQQAVGANPWDSGCSAQWATGRTSYTLQIDPPGTATAPGLPQSLAMGDWAAVTFNAAPGHVLSALDAPSPSPCAVLPIGTSISFYSVPVILVATEPGGCTMTVTTKSVEDAMPAQWHVPITVTVNGGGGRHAPVASPLVHGLYQPFAYTFTPEPGYALQSVTGCDGTLAGNVYTGTAIAACTIEATFQGAPLNTGPATPTPVPGLGTWALALLAALLSMLSCRKMAKAS